MEPVDRPVVEEIVVPEKEGVLSSKRYVTTANGAVLRQTGLAFCDNCGGRLDEHKTTIVCRNCRRKICDSPHCAIANRGRYFCEDCSQRDLPLDPLQFEIIHGLINNLRLSEIRDLTRCKKEAFVAALNQLTANGYLDRKGVSLFAHFEILDRGILAWKTYYRSFSTDGEVAYFMELRQREK